MMKGNSLILQAGNCNCCDPCQLLFADKSSIIATFSGMTICGPCFSDIGSHNITYSVSLNGAFTLARDMTAGNWNLVLTNKVTRQIFNTNHCVGSPISTQFPNINFIAQCSNGRIDLQVGVVGVGPVFSGTSPANIESPITNNVSGPCHSNIASPLVFGGTATISW